MAAVPPIELDQVEPGQVLGDRVDEKSDVRLFGRGRMDEPESGLEVLKHLRRGGHPHQRIRYLLLGGRLAGAKGGFQAGPGGDFRDSVDCWIFGVAVSSFPIQRVEVTKHRARDRIRQVAPTPPLPEAVDHLLCIQLR